MKQRNNFNIFFGKLISARVFALSPLDLGVFSFSWHWTLSSTSFSDSSRTWSSFPRCLLADDLPSGNWILPRMDSTISRLSSSVWS